MNKKNYSNFNNNYLLNINNDEKVRFENNDTNEKKKYIDNSDSRNKNYLNVNSNRNSSVNSNRNSSVDVDSFLRYPPNFYNNKTSVELNKNLDHDNYDVIYSNKASAPTLPKALQKKENINKERHFQIINDKPYIGAGRGIGNLDVSELIRCGQDTRRMNDKFKESQESTITNRFQILDKNLQDPKNIVMNIPRGGIQTRKTKKLFEEKNKSNNINFKY